MHDQLRRRSLPRRQLAVWMDATSPGSRTSLQCATDGTRVVVALPPGGIESADGGEPRAGRGRLRRRGASTSARSTCRRPTAPSVQRRQRAADRGARARRHAPASSSRTRRRRRTSSVADADQGRPARRSPASCRCACTTPAVDWDDKTVSSTTWDAEPVIDLARSVAGLRGGARRARRSAPRCSSSSRPTGYGDGAGGCRPTRRSFRRRHPRHRSPAARRSDAASHGRRIRGLATPRMRVVPANPAKIPPEERLVNLVVALMATEHGLTKEQILGSSRATASSAEAGASKDALEKMFERDKESLRGLGVPIETIGDCGRSRRPARGALPRSDGGVRAARATSTFTPAELAVLQSRRRRLERRARCRPTRAAACARSARSASTVDEPIIGFAPRISLRETAAFAPLQQAIEQSRVVTFAYLKPGEDAPASRRIRPLALVEYEGALARASASTSTSTRTARSCSRASSATSTVTRETFDPGAARRCGRARPRGLDDVAAQQLPRCSRSTRAPRPRCGSAGAHARRRRGSACRSSIVHIFADELASYGPEVRVVEPAALRDEVIARLRGRRRRARRGGAR